MSELDWLVLGCYVFLMLGMGYFIGRKQISQKDYYLAGESMAWWKVGLSLVANQVSAISLIGAPAFIALKSGGGLKWLQYEMAVPLAMSLIITLLVPVFWKTRGLTIYENLEHRFGQATRMLISFLFLVSRSLGAGIALLATAYVTAVCLGLGLERTILLIGFVSIAYTVWGGIRADILTDIVQLAILWGSSLVCIGLLLQRLPEGLSSIQRNAERIKIFDWTSSGLLDGNTYSFWPMLLGGVFLYFSYYGCDQSQAQRLLATSGPKESSRALILNGMLRFPLVLTYCTVGLLMIPFLESHPSFLIKVQQKPPDFLMPEFFLNFVPSGFVGIMVAGVFAASMSSIDSAVNSLSAATWNDFLVNLFPRLTTIGNRRKIRLSRGIATFWGMVCMLFALWLCNGHDTVIELVNKAGSAFYGPVAGVFCLGILCRRAGQTSAIAGLLAGVFFNVSLWAFFQSQVSWMWWNLSGFAGCVAVAWLVSIPFPAPVKLSTKETRSGIGGVRLLTAWFLLILVICLLIERSLSQFVE